VVFTTLFFLRSKGSYCETPQVTDTVLYHWTELAQPVAG